MDILFKYFPDLSDGQVDQFRALGRLYPEWNERINVISRKDIDHLYERHILHSLGILKWFQFKPDTSVMDLGCGGGFPGIPLAIMLPDVHFHLIDARRKKIKVVGEIAQELGLDNVKATHGRAEEDKGHYDMIVTRAVAPMAKMWSWVSKNIKKKPQHEFKNGLVALKGGDIMGEMEALPPGVDFQIRSLSQYYDEDFFDEKLIAYAFRG